MANTLITPQTIAKVSAIALKNRLLAGRYFPRTLDKPFSGKVGDSVKVRMPMAVTKANEFKGSTTASDITQRYVDVTLEKHFYKRFTLTTKELSLSLDDFTEEIIVPAMSGIGLSIDAYLLDKARRALSTAGRYTGTVTTRPTTVAHVLAAQKALDDKYAPGQGRIGVIDTTAKTSFLALDQFVRQDYGAKAQLEGLEIGKRLGAEWVCDPAAEGSDRGDVAGTVLLSGAATKDATTLSIDGLTAATGVIKAGTAFTIAGDTTRYAVQEDAAIASNAASLKIAPALSKNASDDAAVTFEGEGHGNMLFVPQFAAAAIVTPVPLEGMTSTVYTSDNVSVRFSMDGDLGSLSTDAVLDVLVGSNVLDTDMGVIIGG